MKWQCDAVENVIIILLLKLPSFVYPLNVVLTQVALAVLVLDDE